MENPVGLRFRPTDEEIIDDYLRPKNLESNTSHVDGVISTVTICKYDPWELPSHSMIKLKDQVWCFFSRKENKYERGERQIRKTKSGYWKITGKPKDIIGTNGNRQKIGHKRVLMFRFSNNNPNGSKSEWIMHEYHLLSPNQMMMTYTICKVMFKGDERHISSSPPGSKIEHIHSLVPLVNNSGGSEVTQSLIPHDVNNSEGQSTETEGSSFLSQGLQNPPQSSGFIDVQ